MINSNIAQTQRPRRDMFRTLMATCLGNALEWFDLTVYAFFARYISHAIFPAQDETVSLLLTFGSFGVSFLVRPLGAVVLGAYADRGGRKKALLVSISLMMLGSAMIMLVPDYATLGLAAPLLVLLARLIQGFSAGGEFGSATAFLVEHFPARRVFIASWQITTQGVSTVLAAGAGLLLTHWLTEAELQQWGWRVPFAFGLLIGPVGIWIRHHLAEPAVFLQQEKSAAPLRLLFSQHKRRLLAAMGLVVIPTGVTYMINYVPTYSMNYLHLPGSASFAATTLGGVIVTLLTPLSALLAERVGRLPVMTGALLLMLLGIYPAFWLLVRYPTIPTLLVLLCWLGIVLALYFSCVPSLLADLFPVPIRSSGMAISYNVAVPLFGGFAPMLCTLLIVHSGSLLAPGGYLLMLMPLSALALWVSHRMLQVK